MDIFTFFFEISILVNDQNKTFNFLFIIFSWLIIVGKFQLAYLWFSILNFFYLFYKINETVKEEMLTLLEENYVDDSLNSSNPISNEWNLLFLNVSKFTFLVKSPNSYPLLCALLFFKLNQSTKNLYLKKTTQPQSTINIMVNIYLLSQKCFLITENVNEINNYVI